MAIPTIATFHPSIFSWNICICAPLLEVWEEVNEKAMVHEDVVRFLFSSSIKVSAGSAAAASAVAAATSNSAAASSAVASESNYWVFVIKFFYGPDLDDSWECIFSVPQVTWAVAGEWYDQWPNSITLVNFLMYIVLLGSLIAHSLRQSRWISLNPSIKSDAVISLNRCSHRLWTRIWEFCLELWGVVSANR